MEQYDQNNNNPNAPYWVRRIQQANERNLHRTQAETEKLLRQLYMEQNQKLYAQLLDTFNKILNDADKGDGKIYTNDLFLTNKYHELIKYFNECAKAIGGQQLEITEAALLRSYNYAQSVVESFAPSGAVQPSFLVPQAIKAEQAIRQTWCLDGKEFSDRIWLSKENLIKDLSKTMADFLARGENPYTMASGIAKRLDVDLFCAYRIARTETAHAQVKGQTDKYKEMGFTQGKWFATDACNDCQAMDGQVFPLDQLESMIPKHPNCTCSFLVVTD